MNFNPPRRPIVVIGAGIAGLTAAARLQELGVPCVVLERFGRAGGRLNSREGEGWIADHGAQYFLRGDVTLVDMIRHLGLEERRTVIQGGVHHLMADGSIVVPPGGGVDSNRLCIDYGFGYFTEALGRTLNIQFKTPVGAVRWDNSDKTFWWEEGQVFWFEDENGNPIRDEATREVLTASGVILATTPTAARRIASASKCLEKIAPLLAPLSYSSCFTGLYRIAHQKSRFWALEGQAGARLRWLAFEERKAPERVSYQYSLLTVQASPEWSAKLMSLPDNDAMSTLYGDACAVLPDLPDQPISQTYKRWNVAHLESPPLGTPADLGLPNGAWPTRPAGAPFALAGDYVLGPRAEDAAQSGRLAAEQVLSQLPPRRSFLGLELGST